MLALHVLYSLLESFILSPLNKNRRIIIKALLNKHSYRFPAYLQKNFKVPFLYYRHGLYFLFKKKTCSVQIFSTETSTAIFDGKSSSLTDRFGYLKKIDTALPGIGISRENLCITKKTNKILGWLGLSMLFAILFPFIIISSKRKATISIIMLEYLEWIALMETLKVYNCNYLYHFCAYEKDAPFIGWLNKKAGIINHKVPSSNPLKNFYKYTFCDTLTLTTPFQIPEIEELSHNWKVDKYVNWPIENFQKLLPYINDKHNNPQKKCYQLAFLSSGIWLRKEQQHSSLGIGDQESEIQLLEYLKEYLKIKKNLSFLILLHPIEKKTDEIYVKACKHYQSYFENIPFSIGKKEKNSFEYFKEIDLTIAAYSSTNLQRLFCGYKTLYAPLAFKTKLYEDSAIEKIAPTNKHQLYNIIDKALKLSDEDFFKYFNLEKYSHSSYKYTI